MLLRNFQTGFGSANAVYGLAMDGATIGTIYLGNLAYPSQNIHYGGNYNGGAHVVIGAGDTPPTLGDYDMADSSIMASNKMASLTQSATWTKTDGTAVTVQWVNNSNAPITVKEVGLAMKIGNQAYNKAVNVLLARKVLDAPVTIQPNEVYAFTYGITI